MSTPTGRLELVAELPGHLDRVWQVNWHNSGRLLASCSGDQTVRLWAIGRGANPATAPSVGQPSNNETVLQQQQPAKPTAPWYCAEILSDGHKRTIRSVAFSKQAGMIATGSFDATTGIWEAVGGGGRGGDRMEVDDVDLASGATGSDLGYECTAKLEGHENETKSVAWSSTGSLLATCSRDKSVWIWEAIDGDFEVLSVLQEHTQDVKMVVWHPTSDACLASASYDDTIRMWKDDEDDWYCAAVMQGHESTVWAVDFNHDGSALVSVSDDQTVMFWRPDPVAVHTSLGGYRKDPVWKCTGVIRGVHSRCIYSVSWSKQTNLVATAAGDNTICVLAPASSGLDGKSSGNVLPQETWNAVARFERPHGVHDINSIQWNPQPEYANILATAGDDGIVRVWKYIPA